MKRRYTSKTTYRHIKRRIERYIRSAASPWPSSDDPSTVTPDMSPGLRGAPYFDDRGSCSTSDDSIEILDQIHLSDLSPSESDLGSEEESDSNSSLSDSFCPSCDEKDIESLKAHESNDLTFPVVTHSDTGVQRSWRDKLQEWAVHHQITLASLGDLLKLLKPQIPELPVDPKTVLKTGKKVSVENMGQGFYFNFGLKSMLLKRLQASTPPGETVSLNFNIDGVPLYKSTTTSLLLLMCAVSRIRLPPFICAIYYGPDKPTIHMFLKDFCPDLDDLLDDGIVVNGTLYNVVVNAFLCDAPARAYVKCIKGNSGYSACERCAVSGTSFKRRVVFLGQKNPPRTDESFATYEDEYHHTGISPLTEIGVRMVSKFVLEYMHLVCLGVMRKLLFRWRNRKKKYKLSSKMFDAIERTMLEAAKIWPSDFSRKPRGFSILKRWKATELRQFLLYVGPVVLKKHFPKHVYEHFLLLHAAITIFTREDLHKVLHGQAVRMLQDFVSKGKSSFLYGKEFVISNVHSLLHIGDDVKEYGVLDNISAFVFENELHKIKHMIRGKCRPLQEVVNRINSREDVLPIITKDEIVDGPVAFKFERKCGPTAGLSGGFDYAKYILNQRTISLREGENFVMLKNSSVIFVVNFYANKEGLFAIGNRFTQYTNLYKEPIPSSSLGIFRVDQMNRLPGVYPVSKLRCKCLAIPHGRRGSFVIFPFLN